MKDQIQAAEGGEANKLGPKRVGQACCALSREVGHDYRLWRVLA
jgi:hypothetical protein